MIIHTASKEFKIGFFFSAPTKLECFIVDINLKPCLGLGIDIWFSFMNDENMYIHICFMKIEKHACRKSIPNAFYMDQMNVLSAAKKCTFFTIFVWQNNSIHVQKHALWSNMTQWTEGFQCNGDKSVFSI